MVQITKLTTTFRLSAVLLLLVTSLTANAAVTFKFASGTIDRGALKTKMEANISALLTEIDRAGRAGSPLSLGSLDMEPNAKTRLEALWSDARFVVDQPTVVEKCLNDYQGYQVRNIRITMKPLDNTYDQSLSRELTVSLSKKGVITGARLAWETHEDVTKILGTSSTVMDTRQRYEVLKWVEDFRCYYTEKDLKSLQQVFSDDALIITGSVTYQKKLTGDVPRLEQNVKYNVQSKKQYITNLQKCFLNNKRIDVKFDHISVMRNGAHKNVFGVTLHQVWKSDRYSDDGWLFLLWDFTDPEHPRIDVRTWQPEQVVATDGVFSIDDFYLPQ